VTETGILFNIGGGNMNTLIAADSFKGSLSSKMVGEAVARGVLEVDSNSRIDIIPMADGGEGTVEALLYANGGRLEELKVHGPLMNQVTSKAGIFTYKGKTHAILECAESSGLTLVPFDKRNPMYASSYGLGEQIRYMIQKGYRDLIIGLGGSATTDGGTGMLQALGWDFYDPHGKLISPEDGNPLVYLKDFSNKFEIPELKDCRITIASDVSNPFFGKDGAAHVYAGQKGADIFQIIELDNHLARFACLIKDKLKVDLQGIEGAGAAGGIGGALSGCLGAKMQSGIELVLEYTNAAEKIKEADIVFTGEGSLDKQTLYGKVPVGIAKLAKKHGKTVIGLAGKVDYTSNLNKYLDAAFSIQTQCRTIEEAMEPKITEEQIAVTAGQIYRLFARERLNGDGSHSDLCINMEN
jgi:glycerate 2-kinase